MEKRMFLDAVGSGLPHGCRIRQGQAGGGLVVALDTEPHSLAFEALNQNETSIFFKTLHYVRHSEHSKSGARSSIPEEFYDEYRAATYLRSLAPNFVPEVFGRIVVSGRFFGYFMEKADGGTLADAIVTGDATRLGRAVKRLRRFTGIIHGAGVPHGDLNSGNVLFDSTGTRVMAIDPSGYYPGKISASYGMRLEIERVRRIVADWIHIDSENVEFYERLHASIRR